VYQQIERLGDSMAVKWHLSWKSDESQGYETFDSEIAYKKSLKEIKKEKNCKITKKGKI